MKARRSAAAGKGEQKHSVGRWRGGRNTKLHPQMLKGVFSQFVDQRRRACLPGRAVLIRKGNLSKRRQDLRQCRIGEELDKRRTRPVILNRCKRKQRLYKLRLRFESALNGVKDFGRIAPLRQRLAQNSLASSASPLLLYGGSNEADPALGALRWQTRNESIDGVLWFASG